MMPPTLYGLIAEFNDPEALMEATRRAYELGYRRMDAYTPFPVEGLADALGMRRTWVPFVTLACGVAGGVGGYFMEWFSAVIHYPLNVGGRPLHSWPAFVPVTFELTVLCAALGAAIGMVALNGLPRPHHPVFNTPLFEERNQSHFYLCIEAADPLFDRQVTWAFLDGQRPNHVWEVPA